MPAPPVWKRAVQLASVRSAAENALLVTAAAGNKVWIGGTDAASDGTWVWSPSDSPLSYTNWHPGEPNNEYNQDCLLFNFDAFGKWDDNYCTLKFIRISRDRANFDLQMMSHQVLSVQVQSDDSA